MAVVYILHSKSIDTFYIGSCKNLNNRLEEHNNHEFSKGFTKRAQDWQLFYKMEDLTYQQARKIEQHIKRMKSRKYIENLINYPEISERLMRQYM